MSATTQGLEPIKRLGIIAGGGALPEKLVQACLVKDIEPFIVGFEGQTEPALVCDRTHMWTRLGAAGQILKTLKSHDISDIVLIGAIRRPSLSELRPDLKTAEFFTKIGLKAMGDDDLLRVLRDALEQEGLRVHGVHKFVDDLLAPAGVIGRHKPKKADWLDIERGVRISQELGALDVGQSVVVQEGMVLGVEAAEGTDELIRRCKHLRRKGRKGVIVKTCKPQQDKDFDLPTIGPDTVRAAAFSGLGGIVVHAGHALLVDRPALVELADSHKIFLIGVDPHDPAAEQ